MVGSGIWTCKIGEADHRKVPPDGDYPMRRAIREAYVRLTGEEPQFILSGWGGVLTEYEREAVES